MIDELVVAASPHARLEAAETAGVVSWTVTVPGPASTDPEILTLGLGPVRELAGFTSSWGLEFEPVALPVGEPVVWQVTSGRSSNGALPWLLIRTDAGWLALTVHWSGNWRIVTSPDGPRHTITVGLHADGQRVLVPAGAELALPAVTVASGSTAVEATGRLVQHLLASAPGTTAGLPTEWNHWWPYEDAEIDEATFLANAAVAAELGLEVAVLDAGWFGRSAATSDWVAERGDWHLVNEARFPAGLGALAERTRALGIEFGIWIEAEAIGPGARIADERPEIVARGADGGSLGYVCLGSDAGRAHVREQVDRLVRTTEARWIKWDFNLDPGAGCRRDDHGHAGTDGLLRHYLGLYAILASLRAEHPGVVWEACSSGGLRIDPGLAAHVDAFFLSDPDWTEHHLACLWGAAQLLPPRQLLHWPQSEWRGEHRFQKVDYSGTLITRRDFDTKIRAAMLHRFGISVRLTELRPDLRERLREHVAAYDRSVRPLLADGVLRPLTEQPLREERGFRQPAFMLSSADDHLVAAFRLPPSGAWQPVRPIGLDPTIEYEVTTIDGERVGTVTGASLLRDGLLPDADVTSAMWVLARRG